ncbi:MAG: diacylglycerol kinase family protein [Thermoanaerobaculia bacterium]
MRRSVLIYNPKAGRWRTAVLARDLLAALTQRDFQVDARPTDEPGHATHLARQAADDGVEVVFAFGGDGTLRETAAGLLGTPAALGLLPGGTTNVIAHSLGVPADPLRAAAALHHTSIREIDVGLCADDVFLMQASAGLDARIMSRLQPRLKRHFGRTGVLATGLLQWSTYEYPEMELVADGRRLTATFAAVCNLPHYGGKFALAPKATPDDRRLDLVLFRGRGRTATLGFSVAFLRGRHLDRADVECVEVEEVEIRGPNAINIQVDGDGTPLQLPVTIRLAPQRLKVLVPAAAVPTV